MSLYNEVLPEFRRYHAEIARKSPSMERGVMPPLLKIVSCIFRCFRISKPRAMLQSNTGFYRKDGVSERALFVIDENGVIVWSYRSPMAVNPGGRWHPRSAGRTGCLMEIRLWLS